MKKILLLATFVSALAASSAMASSALDIFNTASGVAVTYDNASGAYPVIDAILSQPGTFGGRTYTVWSFVASDSTGSIDMYGSLPSGGSYVPTVGDAISVSGTYMPFNQIPEIGSMTAISQMSTGHTPATPALHSVAEVTASTTLPQNLAGRLVEITNVMLYAQDGTTPATGTFPEGNATYIAKDKDGNQVTVYFWWTSYSMCAELSDTTIPIGTVNIIGLLNVFGTTIELVPKQVIALGPSIEFTNILSNLVRPGDAPTNTTFTEYALRPGETLTINARAYDVDGSNVTISATSPVGSWDSGSGSGTNVSDTYTFTPSAGNAGSAYTATFSAWTTRGTNTTTWTIYVPTAEEQNIVISEFLANPTTDTNSPYFNPLHRPAPGSTNAYADDEFIEIVNANSASFDFIGFSFYDAVSFRHQFYNPTSVGSSNTVVLYGGRLNADPAPPSIPGASSPFSEAQVGVSVLNDSGDVIRLYNFDEHLVARVVYTSATSANGVSRTRFPGLNDDFVEHNSVVSTNVSPGLQPDQRSYDLPVIISEPPTISGIADQTISQGESAGPIAFTVGDPVTPAGDLTLFGYPSYSSLVPYGNIVFGGSGSNRTVTVTPAADQSGLTHITVTVGNADLWSTSTNFLLTVTNTNPGVSLFCDDFSYPDGSIITNSGFVWNAHSGATGQTEVVSSMLELRGSQSEDINRLIPGQPYDSTSDLTLYAGLTVKFSTLPSTGGDYFAHFKDSANGYAARLFASTANAASGQFRLGIANGTGTQVEFPQDLALNTTHGVVIGYDLVTGQSRLWVNPVNEASTSVQDLSSASPIVVTSFAFRQSGGIGSLDVDDLCVGNGFVAVIPTISPGGIPLEAAREGNDLILSWSNPAFTLLTGTNVTGVTNPVLGATSPYTNSIAEPTRYFRLIMQ